MPINTTSSTDEAIGMLEQTWRWFGPADPISLREVRQTGATGIVTALHHLENGTEWPISEIETRKAMIEEAGLKWSVVESIPISEDIKTQSGDWRRHLDAWAQSVVNLSACGIRTICYNFMPVLDWTRTDLAFEMPDGARAMRFDAVSLAAFDIHILKRPGAADGLPPALIKAAKAKADSLSIADGSALGDTILAGLPGSEEGWSLDAFRERLAAYRHIDRSALQKALTTFLNHVVPVAEEHGVSLAVHPDDPPWDLFGLPRIVSTSADIDAILSVRPERANGLTLCTGSLGARGDNDLASIAQRYGDRIHFAHLRSVRREDAYGTFHEAAHLGGDADMVAVLRALMSASARRPEGPIPMRPDHGHAMLDDHRRTGQPGYPLIGRMRGLAELRGIMTALAYDQP